MTIVKDGETYLSTEEACDFLGVTRQTLSRYVRDGRLQQYRQGITRTIYYKQTELQSLADIRPVDRDEQ